MPSTGDAAIEPDKQKRAYILDSLKHFAEVELLRSLYQGAFILIGIVCDADARRDRLSRKYDDAGRALAQSFMERDRRSSDPFGQRVEDTFHLSDAFIDNGPERPRANSGTNNAWTVSRELSRLVDIVTHRRIVRPYPEETAMHAAYAAQTRSACLSRQVGAALIDRYGNLVATGTNEVPRAGGGVYGEDPQLPDDAPDHRCAEANQYCSSTREQHGIVGKLVAMILESGLGVDEAKLTSLLLRSPVTELLEFSRAVHAEMDALLRAARTGHGTIGTRLFVTTFPCHYCARHIVAAGVDEVQYIEPYPKSLAQRLHADSITSDATHWKPPTEEVNGRGKVLFRPFVGVAPRLFRRAFAKDRKLKAKDGSMELNAPPEWQSPWETYKVGYPRLEAALLTGDVPAEQSPPSASSLRSQDAIVIALPTVPANDQGSNGEAS